jgi:hypothetical protein
VRAGEGDGDRGVTTGPVRRGWRPWTDFNYDIEPLTGHYPGRLGLPLLAPSRLSLRPWVSAADRPFWIRIRPASISGRRTPGFDTGYER